MDVGRLKKFFGVCAPGKSVRRLAEECNLDFSFLAKVLRGKAALTDKVAERIARSFLLPPEKFKAFLRGEISLQDFLSAADPVLEKERLRLVDFDPGDPAAWQVVLCYARDPRYGGDPMFRRSWVANSFVILCLANRCRPPEFRLDAGSLHLLFRLCCEDQTKFIGWLSGLESSVHKRLIFHALLFTVDPLGYAVGGGILGISQEVFSKGGDRYIGYPDFAFDLIARVVGPSLQDCKFSCGDGGCQNQK
ncbi:MAG: helix-turn-helix domain-containing protein [Moorellaceae bacterium]